MFNLALKMKHTLFLIFFNLLACHAQKEAAPIQLRINCIPRVTVINDKPTTFYEFHIKNEILDTVELTGLIVRDKENSTVYLSSTAEKLKSMCSGLKTILGSNDSTVVYIEISSPVLGKAILDHVVQIKIPSKNFTGQVGVSIAISSLQPVVLGAPLKSGPWAAVFNPVWERGHRRVFYTVEGKARIPGRYAIDFIKLDTLGRYGHDDQDDVQNWYGYGEKVLAVADGEVVTVLDAFPEADKVSKHPQYTSQQATGNYIVLQIGKELFAFYEHLKPGSMIVKPGQKVKKGDVIARLGFTGQTTGPHLHFHVANRNSPLGAEGIPFVFDKFTTLGTYNEFENFGSSKWESVASLLKHTQAPASNSVIQFY